MNCHIGDESTPLDEELTTGTALSPMRQSMHHKLSRRGEELLSNTDNIGLTVLNGRTVGDIPAQYTFIDTRKSSSTGEHFESSILDLVFCSISMITDIRKFEVLDSIHLSDHLPVTCRLNIQIGNNNNNNRKRKGFFLKWKAEKQEDFEKILLSKLCEVNVNDLLTEMPVQNVVNSMSDCLKKGILSAARECGLMVDKKWKITKNAKWFNLELKESQYRLRKNLRLWKRYKGANNMNKYVEEKRKYRSLKYKYQKEYREKIKLKLQNVKNVTEFWGAIKKFSKKTTFTKSDITKEVWYEHFSNLYRVDNPRVELLICDVGHETLDTPVTASEVKNILRKLKNNKASGPDHIPNEVYKSLSNIDYIVGLFNLVFDEELIPPEWSQSEIFCLYKKGDKSVPGNYRGIGLLNSLSKVFTQLLSSRIYKWAEDLNIIPEEQGGFRRERGCVDQIFALNCLIQIHLRHPKQKLYACFVDVRFAFDAISHDLLWQKLRDLGLSGKLIRLLRSFYEKATCRIRVDAGDELTDEIQVKRGTIQGDSASPLLFLLFTCDLVQYLRDRGFTGIQLSAAVDVMILLYADDMVILGYSKSDLQRKINALREYCCDNDLKINTQKTKVVVFRKSGRLSKDDKFTYEGEELEVVRDFVYLGVKFSSSGLFRNHMIYAMSKSKIALANIKNIMVSSKMDSWESRLKLYSSIVKVTLLYSGEIWALRYYEEIERTQVQFFKTILLTKYNTPNHYIRMETGTLPLSYSVLQSSLRWLIKVQKMSDSRIPKLCLKKLLIMDNSSSNDIRYNWISQVKNMLQTVGLQANDQLENLHDRIDNILETAEEKLFQDDKRRILDSNYNNHYKHIKQLVTRKEEKYLLYKVPIERTRVICQLRTLGDTICLFLNGDKTIWKLSDQCTLCNLNAPEDLEHLLLTCPHYAQIRSNYLSTYIDTSNSNETNIQNILTIKNIQQFNNVYFFIKTLVKRRRFLRDE
ncbi:hypothetical protein M8J77_021397 [Diaphorina citri]|nr:hypothetical protein M8J77_021397 [Diaphorina citri]